MQVVLGVYVNNFRMAGKIFSIKQAWTSLKEHIETGEVSESDGTTYLDCMQSKVDIP